MFSENGPTYVIAEIGANHNGDIELAKRMIDSAKAAGANAAKFQSWDSTIFSKSVYEQNYFLGDDYRNRTDFDLKGIVEEFAVTFEEMKEIAAYCQEVGIDFASTPFNRRQVQELVDLGAPFVKIASMDIDNAQLLHIAGETGLPVVLSTGFAQLAEIDRAVRWVEETGNHDITILHCISLYPPQDEEVNLDNMDMLREAFGYPVGFSDHTMGTEISIASIAKRAAILEKHFTLDQNMFGWDHKISSTPEQIRDICVARDRLAKALGSKRRTVGARELERRAEYRRSIVSARPIARGSILTAEDIDFRRPGTGLTPPYIELVVGMRAVRDIEEDSLLTLADLESAEGK